MRSSELEAQASFCSNPLRFNSGVIRSVNAVGSNSRSWYSRDLNSPSMDCCKGVQSRGKVRKNEGGRLLGLEPGGTDKVLHQGGFSGTRVAQEPEDVLSRCAPALERGIFGNPEASPLEGRVDGNLASKDVPKPHAAQENIAFE